MDREGNIFVDGDNSYWLQMADGLMKNLPLAQKQKKLLSISVKEILQSLDVLFKHSSLT